VAKKGDSRLGRETGWSNREMGLSWEVSGGK
jgi:hypothetical protein